MAQVTDPNLLAHLQPPATGEVTDPALLAQLNSTDGESSGQPAPDGFTDDQRRAILAYLPKAKDGPDLEQFSREISGGKAHVGDAQQIVDYIKKGGDPSKLAWATPTTDQVPSQKPSVADHVRNVIGDGILNAIDSLVPGVGTLLRNNRDTGKAYVEHVANAVGMDYAPEFGGLLDTIASPSEYGGFGSNLDRNVAHERATMEGDSQGHAVASLAGELTGSGVDALLGNEAGLANLSRLGKVGVGAGVGAVYGSGAAGPGDRIAGAATGAALGSATEAAMPIIGKYLAALKSGDTTTALSTYQEATQAAQELGIELPKFVVAGDAAARKASALEQTVGGAKPISDATTKMLDQAEQARNQIAGSVGTAMAPNAIGEQLASSGAASVKASRAAIGSVYDQARAASDGVGVPPTKTLETLNGLIQNEQEVPGGTKILPILQRIQSSLVSGQSMTIDGARGLRTALRDQLRDEAGTTPSNAERLTSMVMNSVGQDIGNGLDAAGKPEAAQLFKQADAQWAQQKQTEDDILRPFLGKGFDAWGEDVAKRLVSNAKGNGTRLAQFLRAIPEDDANSARATLIMHLGSSTPGADNAAGDAFSLDRFLTNWNEIKAARGMIYPPETVRALDKLAKVAEVVKMAGRTRNRSNTGGVASYLMSGLPTLGGAAETLMTGDPKGLAVGMLASALNTVKQYGAAKLLASPAFARKLASTPLNASGARAYWSRPWVQKMASQSPTIAAEIQAFQHAFLTGANDNTAASLAAQPSGNEQDQSAQAQ